MADTIIIAIDGPAASGKGTIARALAAHYDYAYLDTGALYRAVAYYVLAANKQADNKKDALAAVHHLLDNLNALDKIQNKLRSQDVGAAASLVAQIPEVRDAILNVQRDFATTPPDNKAGAILDGRDIGTIVCPKAHVKLYITASPEVRARRRYEEIKAQNITFEAVLAEINQRDLQDKSRKTAPLRQASDAYLLDSSDLSIESALKAARTHIEQTLLA